MSTEYSDECIKISYHVFDLCDYSVLNTKVRKVIHAICIDYLKDNIDLNVFDELIKSFEIYYHIYALKYIHKTGKINSKSNDFNVYCQKYLKSISYTLFDKIEKYKRELES